MRFPLEVRPIDWVAEAPVRVEHQLDLAAPPDEVFAVLADLGGWPRWFRGMESVTVLGERLREVKMAVPIRVVERFDVWEPGQRLGFVLTESTVPGLAAMVEDWRLAPTDRGTQLSIAIGAEGSGLLRRSPKVLHRAIWRSTRGASGLVGVFR